jgi:hypothetical protein
MATFNELDMDKFRSVKSEILVALVLAIINSLGWSIWIISALFYIREGGLVSLPYVEVVLAGFDFNSKTLLYIHDSNDSHIPKNLPTIQCRP